MVQSNSNLNSLSLKFFIYLFVLVFFSKKLIIFNEELLVIISSLTILTSLIVFSGEYVSLYLSNISGSILSKFYYVYSVKTFQLNTLKIFYTKRTKTLLNDFFKYYISFFFLVSNVFQNFLKFMKNFIFSLILKQLSIFLLNEKEFTKKYLDNFLLILFQKTTNFDFINICYTNYYNLKKLSEIYLSKNLLNPGITDIFKK